MMGQNHGERESSTCIMILPIIILPILKLLSPSDPIPGFLPSL